MNEEVLEYETVLVMQRIAANREQVIDGWLERVLPTVDIDPVNDDFDVVTETNPDGTMKMTLAKVVVLAEATLDVTFHVK